MLFSSGSKNIIIIIIIIIIEAIPKIKVLGLIFKIPLLKKYKQ